MKQVRIADLKAHLSQYLRAVRGGETIAVMDRDTPIAQIVPMREATAIKIRKARGKLPVNRISLPKLPKLAFDVVDLLLEDRQRR